MKKILLGLSLLSVVANANLKCKESLLSHAEEMNKNSKEIAYQIKNTQSDLDISRVKILFENTKEIANHIRNNHGTEMGIDQIKLLNKIEPNLNNFINKTVSYTPTEMEVLVETIGTFRNISVPKEYKYHYENENYKLTIAENQIKDKLRDPDSYKRLKYSETRNKSGEITAIIIEYTAKNGFGGTNREKQTINF